MTTEEPQWSHGKAQGSVNVIRQKIDENQTNANALLESQYISGTPYAHNPKIKDRF